MFRTQPVLLKTLLCDVELGKLQLPDFQRKWVWDDERITGLLESISRGFPVGAIMTLSAGGDIRFKPRPIEGVNGKVTDPEKFLLDGQQRLTSLYQALLLDGPVKTQNSKRRRIKRWYFIDMLKALDPDAERDDVFISVPEDKQITEDFGRRVVIDLSSQEKEFQNHMMPTERLLDSMTWILGYNQFWSSNQINHPSGDLAKFLKDFDNAILYTFGSYLLPVINLETETPKEAVCNVFEKVNTGGVTLTVFELVTASFAAEARDGFRLREDWASRSRRLREKYGVLHGIEGENFLQAIALLTTNERRKKALASGVPDSQAPGISCKKETILNLTLGDYKQWADSVERGLEETAEFLHNQFIFRHRDVPYSTQLVPLAALYVELGRELQPAKAQSLLEHWFWSGIFGESYGGNTETQFALDMRQVAEYVRNGNEPTLVTQANFIPERLLTLRTRNSAAYKGLYALQMKSGAADWRTERPLSLLAWHSKNIDIHHVFPKAWCQRKKPSPVPRRLYDSIINKTPIDAQTNRIIGGRGPSIYIPRLEKNICSKNLDNVLIAHWLRPDLLRADKFAECFVARGAAMLELVGKAMKKPIPDGREVFLGALTSAGFEASFVVDEIEDDDVGDVVRLSGEVTEDVVPTPLS